MSSLPLEQLWAKTIADGTPGISVEGHCLNVGCVAEALIERLSARARELIPQGGATLSALHDLGKISVGFLVKCPRWVALHGLTETAVQERWAENAERDHAKVSQFALQQWMKPSGTHLWAVAAGVHHGRIFGSRLQPQDVYVIAQQEAWEQERRKELLERLSAIFGPLPAKPPLDDRSDLWLLAGVISVADWIGSNERFFPTDRGLSVEQSRAAARQALGLLHWGGGKIRSATFGEMFGGYRPKPLQQRLQQESGTPGLFIVEGPMGCGKTEAALWAAHSLIAAGVNDGLYFALPTQVTSNRIHQRVGRFLTAVLEDAANLRLAHSASWLDDEQTVLLRPANGGDADAESHVHQGRSWFASSKHALLARYGVGTVDQALQSVVAVKHFFVRRFGLAGKVVILDEVHSYDVYTGTLITQLIRVLLALRCSVIVLSATLTQARRRELIAAAGGDAGTLGSTAYPLITVARPGAEAMELPIEASDSRPIRLKTAVFPEEEIIAECIARAEAGQHVLWLRNTVAEAQATCRAFMSAARAGLVEIGLLHSRFPFFRRQELENEWLQRLGKDRVSTGPGSILVATQVVEQSVDIDLDFIVSDLAPTDMLLQRMGRLWRHERPDRLAVEPEFWINAPELSHGATERELKMALGKSGRVYAPYVLLRSAQVFAHRTSIRLPGDIREVLEATYAEASDEPKAWEVLRGELEKERDKLAGYADAATRVLSRPTSPDDDEVLTRRSGAPTIPVVLLRSCERAGGEGWRITGVDGETLELSSFEWSIHAARLLHRNLVRVPRHSVPRQPTPPWLSLHARGLVAWALVAADGHCDFPEAEGPSALAYHPTLGLHTPLSASPQRPTYQDDDDEFDS